MATGIDSFIKAGVVSHSGKAPFTCGCPPHGTLMDILYHILPLIAAAMPTHVFSLAIR